MKIPFPLVRVHWIDAECANDWVMASQLKDEIEKANKPVTTEGRMVYSDDKWLFIASTCIWTPSASDWQLTSVMHIPKGMVENVEYIERKSRKKAQKEASGPTASPTP